MKKEVGVQLVYCRTLSSQSGASLTMGSLAAALREENIPVKIKFMLRTDLHRSSKILIDINDFPIIIYKPNFKDFQKYFPLFRILKEKSNIRIFIVGPYATLNAMPIMKEEKWVDGIILGEPEKTVVDLINSLNRKNDRWDFKCPGGIWRNPKTNEIISGGVRAITKSLDELPFPARDIEKKEDVAYVNIEGSRGCIFNCSFCHVPLNTRKNECQKRRLKSPKKIVDEMESLLKLGKSIFIFNDPLFWAKPSDDQRIRNICNLIIKSKLNLRMYIYLRSSPFPSDDLLDLMVKAGVIRVFLGIENASENSLKNYNKGTTPNKSLIAWNKLKSRGINVHIGYITFEPYSTLPDIKKNINFVYKLKKLYRIGVLLEPPRIIPDSSLHKELINSKLMSPKLNYRKLTYGYRFANKDVGIVFNSIRDIFLVCLKKRWYELEYYCVSGLLFIDLAKREKPQLKKQIESSSLMFRNHVDKCNQLIYTFLMSLIKNKNLAEDSCFKKEFVNQFLIINTILDALWGKLVSDITEMVGERPYRMLYRGLETLS